MIDLIKAKALGAVSIAALVVIGALLLWGMNEKRLREYWQGLTLAITAETASAAHKPRMKPKDVVDEIRKLGDTLDETTDALDAEREKVHRQNLRVRAWEAENARLQKLAAEERKRAQAAIAKRDAAIARLSADVVTPGDRADCAKQIREAEAILLYLFEEGN